MNDDIAIIPDDNIDDHVDVEIAKCLDLCNPKSFFMFAGAGSGKTRSLVNALKYLNVSIGKELCLYSRQVAVITYTNAACDEIMSRMGYNPLFAVSTIHSFIWDLIKDYQCNIKAWVITHINEELTKLEIKQHNGRSGSAMEKRTKEIEKKRERLERIAKVRRFSYNPNGENVGYDSLNHTEVIAMGSDFIMKYDLMQKLLIARFPVLLIDESQDTNKNLIDAIFSMQQKNSNDIVLGLFGDTMQKIYLDGKDNLSQFIPDSWEKPTKVMNHRCCKRIVELINLIRKDVDGQKQLPRADAKKGIVRLFIANCNADKANTEKKVANTMITITGNTAWQSQDGYEELILEHQMAANRLGFAELFSELYAVDSFKNGILDGSLPIIRFFTQQVLPIVIANRDNNKFKVAKVVRQYSPFLRKSTLITASENQIDAVKKAREAVDGLVFLFNKGNIPTCIEILENINKSGLLEIPDQLKNILTGDSQNLSVTDGALKKAFSCSFTQIETYNAYISEKTRFATHQGVKGLEFPHVMVIVDDAEAKGFLFSYEKLFGAKAISNTDKSNIQDGKDNSVSRTKRLFYVACSRAEDSLAILAYTSDPEVVKQVAIKNRWFIDNEIIMC